MKIHAVESCGGRRGRYTDAGPAQNAEIQITGDLPMSKAFRFYETGGPDVLRFEDTDVGDPGSGQVRIRHTAIAVNYRDICVRSGLHPQISR